jgi:RHS repeat-associated protein
VVCRHDYYPYGKEVGACTDGETHKFTGKERDAESGLDYFIARHYSSNLGRFLQPDWAAAPTAVPYADFGNPQSLNLYQYVGNNPITSFDADGHCWPPGQCARIVMNAVNQVQQKVEQAAIATGNPTLAAAATFQSGMQRDAVNGVVGALTVGEASGVAMDSGNTTQQVLAAVEDGGKAGGIALMLAPAGSALNARVSQSSAPAAAPTEPTAPTQNSTLSPGPFADVSVPARGPQPSFTSAERAAMNNAGVCHTCGTTNPGTKSGNFVPDHQPPSALNPPGNPQRLYPQCIDCMRRQGGEVNAAKNKAD